MKVLLITEPGDDGNNPHIRVAALIAGVAAGLASEAAAGPCQSPFEQIADGLRRVAAAREQALANYRVTRRVEVVALDPLQVARLGALAAVSKGEN